MKAFPLTLISTSKVAFSSYNPIHSIIVNRNLFFFNLLQLLCSHFVISKQQRRRSRLILLVLPCAREHKENGNNVVMDCFKSNLPRHHSIDTTSIYRFSLRHLSHTQQSQTAIKTIHPSCCNSIIVKHNLFHFLSCSLSFSLFSMFWSFHTTLH